MSVPVKPGSYGLSKARELKHRPLALHPLPGLRIDLLTPCR